MVETAQIRKKPFAGGAAGMAYFASEAHYRLLAAALRDQLQQHGGCVLLTGAPAPNSDLLARQLTVVGAPRCRTTILKCQAQMNLAGVMDSYRRLTGSTIEAVTRRVASWSIPGAPAPADGQEIRILVLAEAERLGDEVLEQLFCSPAEVRQDWPPLLLVADRSLADRLEAGAIAPSRASVANHFDLLRLIPHEVGSFIRYQLTVADLDQLALFKPPVIELIEIYADGDPMVVNALARRILRIVPELTAKRRLQPRQERAEDQAIATATFSAAPLPATDENPPPAVTEPPVPPFVEATLPPATVPSPLPEGRSGIDDSSMAASSDARTSDAQAEGSAGEAEARPPEMPAAAGMAEEPQAAAEPPSPAASISSPGAGVTLADPSPAPEPV